ncbi:hypothetical protein LSUB1_G003908 [Lachnellula subtilissima]|uniref:Mso1 N-terminal domain-containing protein n=1 Tax=Lachnellula subtilissima TaxID=602034 RepID=A0A8H8RUQ2_9HELO|nr:hypothetical protein LSUB1_G003908 [Lachnellula subtilissima]
MSYMHSFSTLLTSTTSRFASVKNTLLATENDGDTEDDTHICRVLRNYYDDKRQPYPGWLPPDPKAPTPQQPALVMSNVGAGYGGLSSQQQGAPGQSGQLSSLWGTQPQAQSQSQPKRRPALGTQRQVASATPTATVNSRLLPSQNARSYQNAHSYQDSAPSNSDAPLSTKDKMKARMNPKRAVSPLTRPAEQGRQGSYDSTSRGGNEDSYSSRDSPRSGASSQPVTSANAPWLSGDKGFTPEAYQASGQGAGARQGLPSGPRAGRTPAGYRSNQPGY